MENSIYLENQNLRINELRLKRRIEELEAKVKEQELAINYSQCCTTLKDKEVMAFDEWTKQNKYEFTRATYFDENGTIFFDRELKQMYNQYKNSL